MYHEVKKVGEMWLSRQSEGNVGPQAAVLLIWNSRFTSVRARILSSEQSQLDPWHIPLTDTNTAQLAWTFVSHISQSNSLIKVKMPDVVQEVLLTLPTLLENAPKGISLT